MEPEPGPRRVTMAVTNTTTNTSGPPFLSSARLAAKPIDAKNVFCSGTCSAVSNLIGWMSWK